MSLREDCCIILNEREPLKLQMALELQTQLQARHYRVSRLPPTAIISDIVVERSPRTIVLDYLLGDIGTALDLLSQLREHLQRRSFFPVIWTDDPSVNVAVSAMKLGAYDYIEFDSPKSLDKVVQAVERAVIESNVEGDSTFHRADAPGSREPIICQSEKFKECVRLAVAAGSRSDSVIVLVGEHGTGKTLVSQTIHAARQRPGKLIQIDLDTWDGAAEDLWSPGAGSLSSLLSYGTTVAIDHIDFDTGDILNALQKAFGANIGKPDQEGSILIAGTVSVETARAWRRLLGASVIAVPSLDERREDFLPLVQRFVAEAAPGGRRISLSASMIHSLTSLRWPGNVRQLRAVMMEAVSVASLDDLFFRQTGERRAAASTTADEDRLFAAVINAKERWESFEATKPYVPPAVAARRVLTESRGNYRIAAARLGTGVPQLRLALKQGDPPYES